MRRALLLSLAAVALLCAQSATAAGDEIRKEKFQSGGKGRTYYLYVPKAVEASKTPAPLLLVLHGSGRNGLSLVEKWKGLAAKEDFIVAGPDALGSGGWDVPRDGPEGLRDLVEELKTKYPIDPRRVYLFGHSAGAGMALMLALLESEYFAAAALHAGALPQANYDYVESAKRKTPISIIVGTNDPFVPLAVVRATRDKLNRHGFDARLAEIPQHGHWYYDRAAEFNRTLWDFLKAQKLDADPKYEQHNFRE
jgi:poly(3-hydroxybutyrate) depolymerase